MADKNGMLKSGKIAYAVFGYGEFVRYCLTTPKHPKTEEESSLRVQREENPWAGTDTWETAVDYAQHGWDAGIQAMQDYIETDATLINIEHALVGHAVDVGRFMTGVPDSMVTFYDDSYRNKATLTLYTKLTYLCDISGEQAMEYTSKILETIAILNRTFNIKLVGVFDSVNKSKNNMVLVNIKDTDDPFVFNNLAFAYNPAFFRRFWFKWLETTDMWASGYGSTPDGEFGGKNACGNALRDILPPDEQSYFMPDIYHRKDINPVSIAEACVKEKHNREANRR